MSWRPGPEPWPPSGSARPMSKTPAPPHPCTSNRMRLNEDGLAAGVAVHVGVVLHNLSGGPT